MDSSQAVSPQIVPQIIQQDKIPPGGILPRHLAASTSMKTGDIYYVNSQGVFQKLPAGSTNQFLTIVGGIPAWTTGAASDGWVSITATLTYSSTDGHTFIVTSSADLTGAIGLGDRIKFTNNATTFYGIVTAITTTTITIYGGTQYSVANSAITSPYYSHAKSPFGFIAREDYWKERLSNNTGYQKATPTASTWYDISAGVLLLNVPIGIWKLSYSAIIYANNNSVTVTDAYSCLSTSNSSVSDTDFVAAGIITGASAVTFNFSQMVYRQKTIALTVKTPYYFIMETISGAAQIWVNPNNNTPTILEAVCSYL